MPSRHHGRMSVATHSDLLRTVEGFFTDRLMGKCNASPLTIANYRDAFRLLIGYAERCLKKPPAKLAVRDLDPAFITRFLDYLERESNCARTRNIRWQQSIRSSRTRLCKNPVLRQLPNAFWPSKANSVRKNPSTS